MRGGAIEDDFAGTRLSGDGVSLESLSVGEVADEDTFVGNEAGQIHQLGIDGKASFVVKARFGHGRAVNFRF